VVLIAGLVSAKWAALTTAPRYRTLDLPQACKPAFPPALCLACLPRLPRRAGLGTAVVRYHVVSSVPGLVKDGARRS
jgi:hypothetical protein